MAASPAIIGVAYEQHGFIILARIYGEDSVLLQQSSVTSIEYDVWRIGNERSFEQRLGLTQTLFNETPIKISGPDTLVVADTIFDTLQTDERWNVDDTGYNFAAAMPASTLESIPKGEYPTPRRYSVPIRITPVVGEVQAVEAVVESHHFLFGKI